MAKLLSVRDLHVCFATDRGTVAAVNGASFELDRGRTLGIVGESGSGKTVSALAIVGLLPSPPARILRGEVEIEGRSVLGMRPRELRALRGDRVGIVFQDPMTSLNPLLRIDRQLTEVLEVHRRMSRRTARAAAIEMLDRVGIPSPAQRIRSYPHELSGGMRQRVMIAMALLCEPALLVADEPTTALDVTIQAQILELLTDLRRERGMAVLLITHDLGVVAGFADEVAVMYGGQVVEHAATADLFARPRHPYTRGLLRCVPRLEQGTGAPSGSIPGRAPVLRPGATGCPFAPRCDEAGPRCSEAPPDSAGVRCWLACGGEENQA